VTAIHLPVSAGIGGPQKVGLRASSRLLSFAPYKADNPRTVFLRDGQ
jgi:hypothetical protein